MWPVCFEEWRPDRSDGMRILREDISSYAFPPWSKDRYTTDGWKKAVMMMAEDGRLVPAEALDVRFWVGS